MSVLWCETAASRLNLCQNMPAYRYTSDATATCFACSGRRTKQRTQPGGGASDSSPPAQLHIRAQLHGSYMIDSLSKTLALGSALQDLHLCERITSLSATATSWNETDPQSMLQRHAADDASVKTLQTAKSCR